MESAVDTLSTGASWPPPAGEMIRFKTKAGVQSGILKEVRWGLLWRDFILEDGRVLAEERVIGAPASPIWREPTDVSKEEQQAWEEQLVVMATSGLDPHDRESEFWAALTQYLAYTYLRFRRVTAPPSL